jgi:hypothetical protein
MPSQIPSLEALQIESLRARKAATRRAGGTLPGVSDVERLRRVESSSSVVRLAVETVHTIGLSKVNGY